MRHILNRRQWLVLAAAPVLAFQGDQGDWTCPMDRDVHSSQPGKCPRCGMTLVAHVPDNAEYPITLTVEPLSIAPGQTARLSLRVSDPQGRPIRHFETVHEKLIHLFVVSQDLEFFAHVHPEYREDGSFVLELRLPKPGMYRLLADYYPSGSVPQLALETLYVKGSAHASQLTPTLTPQRAENTIASVRLEPDQPVAGLETRMYYTLQPDQGLEQYLGAWGHMLIASEDLIDLIHLHPFLADHANIQYNAIFPRAGTYKVWSQFQRLGVVNTVAVSVAVKAI